MFTEDMGPKALPRAGFGKDSVEVEGYVRGFSRRRPDVEISMLRFANIIGPRHPHRADRLLRPAGRPGAVRLRRPAAVRPRGRRAAALLLATTGRRRRHHQHRRRRRHHRDTGGPAGRPPDRARCRCRPPAARPAGPALRAGRLLPRPDAVPRLRPGHGHHPDARGAAASSRAYTTRAAFEDFVARRGRHRCCRAGGASRGRRAQRSGRHGRRCILAHALRRRQGAG